MPLPPKKLHERHETLKARRGTLENHWQELADYILPNKNNITTKVTMGEKRNTHLFDNTAIQSNELLAGALHGLLTNPYAKWFELTSGDPDVDDLDDVRLWLQDTSHRMHNVLNDSNFQTEIHEYYLDLCCFGTAPMMMEEDDEFVVRFMATHVGDLYVSENNKGVIDEIYRSFEWPARLIVREFGEEGLSKRIMDAYRTNDDKMFEVCHSIYPNTEYEEGPFSQFNFISQYTLKEDDSDIKIEGFQEFPFIVGRWSKVTGEEYGRSPGMTALPEAKTINKMTEMVLLASAKMIDPPLQLPDDGFILPLKTKPGGINYYRAGTQDRVEAIFNKEYRIDFGEALMEKHRQRIREAFFVDQLQLGNGPQMTATEVNQRTEEKMRLLGPILGRQQNELLAPLINRLFQIMNRRRLLKPAPQEIRKLGGIGVRYSSMIARLQKQNEGESIMRTIELSAPFVQVAPEAMDMIDSDKALMEIARIYGAPQKIFRPRDEVEKIRKSRAQAQQIAAEQQQQMMQAEQINKVAPVVKG